MAELTNKQLEMAERIIRSGGGRATLAKAMGLSAGQSQRIIEAIGEGMNLDMKARRRNGGQAAFVKNMSQVVGDVYEEAVRKVAEIRNSLDRSIVVKPYVEGPYALAFVADVHEGDDSVDYKAFDRDMEIIRETEGMEYGLGGDMIDNHIRHMAAMVAANVGPAVQWEWLRKRLERDGHKCRFIVGGNHENWTVALTGIDMLKEFSDRLCIPYDTDEIAVKVVVGDYEYKVAIRHKYRFNSALNPNHSVKRYWEFGNEDFDVGVVCHNHVASVEPFVRHRKVRWALRPGTYQVQSRFARREGYHGAVGVCPAAVFFPHEQKVYGCFDVEEARLLLKAARQEWYSEKRKTQAGGKAKKRSRNAKKGRAAGKS